MDIHQNQLNPKEQALLGKVMDFNLERIGGGLCFKEIEKDLTLRLDIPRKSRQEPLGDPAVIIQAIEETERQIELAVEGAIKADNNDDKEECRRIGKKIALLREKKACLEALLSSPVKNTILFGEFSPSGKEVFLYLDEIADASTLRETLLASVFIHEMMHAWSSFGNQYSRIIEMEGKKVREIEEPMVEFATLLFLEEISKIHPEFRPILEDAKMRVEKKKSSVGSVSAYGFGHYLWGLHRADTLPLLGRYFELSHRLSKNTSLVSEIQGLLNPVYPSGYEQETFTLIRRLVLDYSQTLYKRIWTKPQSAYSSSFRRCLTTKSNLYRQVWTPSGKKTNLLDRRNDRLLLEDNVDAIEKVSICSGLDGLHWAELLLIKAGPSMKLYFCSDKGGVLAPLIPDDLAEVTVADYGRCDSLVVKRSSDGRFDIVSILEIAAHISDCCRKGDGDFRPMSLPFDLDDVIFLPSSGGNGEMFIFAEVNGKRHFVFPIIRRRTKRVSEFEVADACYGDETSVRFDEKGEII